MFDEFRIFSAGDRSVTLDVDGATIGVAICEDIWQDGGPVADLATKNIDLLLTINGSPYEEGKTNTRFELAQRRAAEVNAPVIYLNQSAVKTTSSSTAAASWSTPTARLSNAARCSWKT